MIWSGSEETVMVVEVVAESLPALMRYWWPGTSWKGRMLLRSAVSLLLVPEKEREESAASVTETGTATRVPLGLSRTRMRTRTVPEAAGGAAPV